jgi:hypothetical protein
MEKLAELKLDGRTYVVLPKAEYLRLRGAMLNRSARRPSKQSALRSRGSLLSGATQWTAGGERTCILSPWPGP